MIQASEDEQRVNPSLLSFLEQIVAPALGVEPTIEVVHGNKQQVSSMLKPTLLSTQRENHLTLSSLLAPTNIPILHVR